MLLYCQFVILLFIHYASSFILMDFTHYTNRPRELLFDLYLHDAPDFLPDIVAYDGVVAAMNAWNHAPYNQLTLSVRYVNMRSQPCPEHDLDTRTVNVICFKRYSNMIPALARYRGFSIDTKALRSVATTPRGVDIWVNPDIVLNTYTYYNMLLHEFGHANLLDHSQYYGTVMSNYMTYLPKEDRFLADESFLYLSQDDKDAIAYLYTGYMYRDNAILTLQRYTPKYVPQADPSFAPIYYRDGNTNSNDGNTNSNDEFTYDGESLPDYDSNQDIVYPLSQMENVVVYRFD